jgi:hypothetical protein
MKNQYKRHLREPWIAAILLLAASAGLAQPADDFGIARLQQSQAYRASSNNADPSGSLQDIDRLLSKGIVFARLG